MLIYLSIYLMHLSAVCLSVSTNVILCVYLGDDMDRWVAWLICGWLVDLLVYCLGHWPTNQLLHGLTLQIWRGSFLLKLVQNKEQCIYRYLPIEFHVYTPLLSHVSCICVCVCVRLLGDSVRCLTFTPTPIQSPPSNHLKCSCIGQGWLLLFRPQAGKHINQALWETIASATGWTMVQTTKKRRYKHEIVARHIDQFNNHQLSLCTFHH